MMQDDLALTTLNNTFTTIPIKQKIYLFSTHDLPSPRKNPERPSRKKEYLLSSQCKQLHNVWKPTLPSKRLFQQPKFFLSLQRKKFRIINGMKDMSLFCSRSPPASPCRNRKAREGGGSLRKISSSIETMDLHFQSMGRMGWQPNNKTPYLNFNMQYLLKKRKSMTPSLYKGAEKLGRLSAALQ